MAMKVSKLLLAVSLATAGLLAGCATPSEPSPTAEAPYCYKSHKGRVIACTQAPAPSLSVDVEAKRFRPDPLALTVYVVRRNWGDGRHIINVQADDASAVETLPNTMVRMKLKPGQHSIAFEFKGRRQNLSVEGSAGDVRFVRIDGMVWAWKSTFEWSSEPEAAIRERALKARLVADVAVL